MEDKRERADSKRNLEKVAVSVLQNPSQTQREIAKDAWVWLWTVNAKLNDLEQITKDPRISNICDTDLEIVTIWQWILLDKLTDPEVVKKMKPYEVSQVISENTKRYSLFRGDATDKDGWLKQVSDVNISIDG